MSKNNSKCMFIVFVVLLIAFGLAAISCAQSNSASNKSAVSNLSAEDLLDLLVSKDVITVEEAAELQRKAEEIQEKKKKEAQKPTYPNYGIKVRLETRYSSVQKDDGQPNWGSKDDVSGQDGFTLRRARFHLTGQLNPEISYNTIFSSDFGASSPTLLIGCMEYEGMKNASLKAGIINVPFGWEIQTNDSIYLQADLSAVSMLIPPDKDVGVRLDSKKPLFGNLNYQIMAGNGSGRNMSNPNRNLMLAGRFYNPLGKDATIGLSLSRNPNTDTSTYQSRFLKVNTKGDNDLYGLAAAYKDKKATEQMWGLDFIYAANHNTMRAEYMRMNVDPKSLGSKIGAKGWYAVYGRGLEYKGVPDRLELIAGVQKFDPNTIVKDKFDLTSYVLGANIHIGNSKRYGVQKGHMACESMLRLNYIWNDEARDSVKNNKWIMQYQTWF